MKRCIVIGAAPETSEKEIRAWHKAGDAVFCADGGAKIALQMGLAIDLVVGDLDSWTSPNLPDVEFLRLPREKDETDMQYALEEGIRRGFRSFVLLGGLGGRLDHTMANIASLEYLKDRGCEGILADAHHGIRIGRGETLRFDGQAGRLLSIFPHGCPECVVDGVGTEYTLDHLTLRSGFPLGVSNRITQERCHVTVEKGTAVFIFSRENEVF